MNPLIRVALIEDDPDIRASLGLIIDGTPGYECSLLFKDAESGLRGIPSDLPDIVLMDIQLPGMSGIEATRTLKTSCPDLDILMLTAQVDDQSVFESLKAGACGYLRKDTPPARLLQAIDEVHQGGSPMSPDIARRVLASFRPETESPLSARETEILALLCEGMTYGKVAEKLFVSGHTIRSHIKNIYQKLHVHSRAEAVNKALRDKLI